jgi:hypothetical protein
MITREFEDHFTQEWIDSWNSHNLERILPHYTDNCEMSSPYIATIAGEPSGVLKAKAALAAYWAKALEHIPTLHFEMHSTLVGTESLVIYYRGMRGMVAELFFFDPHGKVTKAFAHYA